MVGKGKLRHSDENAGEKPKGEEGISQRHLLMVEERLQHQKKQRKCGIGDCSDGNRGHPDGLKKGCPVGGQEQAGQAGQHGVFSGYSAQRLLSEKQHREQDQGGTQDASAGQGDGGHVDDPPDHAAESEHHDGQMQGKDRLRRVNGMILHRLSPRERMDQWFGCFAVYDNTERGEVQTLRWKTKQAPSDAL